MNSITIKCFVFISQQKEKTVKFISRYAVPENIHTPPTEEIEISWGGGGGVLKTKKCKEMYEAKLQFPGGV